MSTSLRPIRQRLAFAASVLGVLFAIAPAAASAAGSAAVTNWGQLNFIDVSTAGNRLTVTPLGSGVYRLTDAVGINAGARCTQLTATEVKCSGVSSFYVSTGNGDDEAAVNLGVAAPYLTLLGGAGADLLQTGAGVDSIWGGDGADVIEPGGGADKVDAGAGSDTVATRDGVADDVRCGADSDSGQADPGDTVATDCESVDKSVTGTVVQSPQVSPPPSDDPAQPGDTPTEPGATSPPIDKIDPLANPLPVIIPKRVVKLDSQVKAALVPVTCPAGTGRCKGTVKLEVSEAHLGKAQAAAAKLVSVGSARFVAKAGAKPVVKVRLSRRGRRRIVRGRKRQRCRITVSTTSPTGKTLITRRTITLERRTPKRPPKKRTK